MNGNNEKAQTRWMLLGFWAHATGVVCWIAAVFLTAFLLFFHRLPSCSLGNIGELVAFVGVPLTCVAACGALHFKLALVRVHLVAAGLVVVLTVVGWFLGK